MKRLIIVGTIVVVVAFGFVIWGGISIVKFAGNQLANVTVESCWNKAQTLMNIESWFAAPVTHNLNDLKTACIEEEQAVICEGLVCEDTKKRMNTAESEKKI